MDYCTFPSALTALLQLHDHPARPADILAAMEAPYLFLKRDGCYIAGVGFFAPKWMHLYLQPLGLQLTEHPLSRADLGSFLKQHTPALLYADNRCLVVKARSGQRICLAQPKDGGIVVEKNTTLPTLLKYTPEQLTAYTLDSCTPAPIDFPALLAESTHTLQTYPADLFPLLNLTVTREDMRDLHTRYFRALLTDLPALATHYHDELLQDTFHVLNHAYRHLFIIGEETAELIECLSKRQILRCLSWLREDIIDRLYTLGAPDELLEQCYNSDQHQK